MCIRDRCPYNAISRIERPCAKACGMDAIGSDEKGRAKIDYDKCVSCGMCLVSCPFGAIVDKGQKMCIRDRSYAMKIAHCISPDFALWSGNDDITIPLLSIGGSGVISVWANVMPREVHDMVMDYLEGRREQAVATAVKYLDLANGLFMEVNPIPVKTALNMMGWDVGPFRLPLDDMSEDHQAALRRLLEEAGLLG